jgi:hypothetical protein
MTYLAAQEIASANWADDKRLHLPNGCLESRDLDVIDNLWEAMQRIEIETLKSIVFRNLSYPSRNLFLPGMQEITTFP